MRYIYCFRSHLARDQQCVFRCSVVMAGWQVPAPGSPPNAAPPAAATGAIQMPVANPVPARQPLPTPAPAHVRTVDRGGNPENRWEYDMNTQIYTRWWAVSYAGLWFDGYRTRPVRWTLEDMQRTVVDDLVVYQETWSWEYLQ